MGRLLASISATEAIAARIAGHGKMSSGYERPWNYPRWRVGVPIIEELLKLLAQGRAVRGGRRQRSWIRGRAALSGPDSDQPWRVGSKSCWRGLGRKRMRALTTRLNCWLHYTSARAAEQQQQMAHVGAIMATIPPKTVPGTCRPAANHPWRRPFSPRALHRARINSPNAKL